MLLFGSFAARAQKHESREQIKFSIPKTIYFGGERVWISSEAMQGNAVADSKIIYAELVNRYNESVALVMMPLEKGKSFNYLPLPTDLPSDHYLLRVFTRISPYQSLDHGLVQQFITVFNRQFPPEISKERSHIRVHESKELAGLNETYPEGSTFTIQLPSAGELFDLTISMWNPFLDQVGQLVSSEIYERIESKDVVPELFGHVIEAEIKGDTDTTQLYYISLHGQNSALFTDRPDENGKLYFDAGGMKNWDYLVAQADGNKSLFDFEIQSPGPKTHFSDKFTFPELKISPEDEPLLTALLQAGQVEGYFIHEFDTSISPVVTGFVEDRTYLLDDYTRFETVETVIKEYVPEISVRTVDKKKEFRSINETRSSAFRENPLMLVDAMPVFDSDRLAAFNPKEFEKLAILNRTFYLNEEAFPGVMSFSSYKNDFGGFSLPSNGILLEYKGVQPAVIADERLFYPLQKEREVLDWRSVLYWSDVPGTNTQLSQLTLKLPNTKAKFLVNIKMRTREGEEKVFTKTFEIK